jgi:hypothetical protein
MLNEIGLKRLTSGGSAGGISLTILVGADIKNLLNSWAIDLESV